jgi:type I restriction enzyme M protein
MAIKKSELYSSLWKSCDELRGGMDASQYKDYVLVLLFVKYVSDKYGGQQDVLLDVPEGAGFADMVALKGDKEIGDKINKLIGRLAEVNDLKGVIDVADFNDADKLGKGKEMVDRLSNLVAIFDTPGLDFKGNTAEGDDIMGDAYEYLMRHFATESGKSKGQFYTPAEVSRVLARVVGIGSATRADQTIHDLACGSGSLLLKAHDEAKDQTGLDLTIYGQEMDNATAALAKMNMILHNCPTAVIVQDNSLSSPFFKQPDSSLKTFDFVVANPPFSTKAWSNGFNPAEDEYKRFGHGIPPTKNGDYAFLLHILTVLKSTGKGAVILPHGVLFRGNAEADIRKSIVRKGYLKGIIGLPANLFYGTGIPACVLVLDKENAAARKGVFMIDASKDFLKDGNKNRLRAQDMHKIVDAFTNSVEIAGFSRMVPLAEISDPKNDYNLNLPRYIDGTELEDVQDLSAHLRGGIPNRDLDALAHYWQVLPNLRAVLLTPADRPGYSSLLVTGEAVKTTIFGHFEFKDYIETVTSQFRGWRTRATPLMTMISIGDQPKKLIAELSENLLRTFRSTPLLDQYDVYQRLMDYWAETMQDDVYLLVLDGWKAITDGSPNTDLLPPVLLVARYFAAEASAIEQLEAAREAVAAEMEELDEEHGGEDGLLADAKTDAGKLTKASVKSRLADIRFEAEADEERDLLTRFLALSDKEVVASKTVKEAKKALDAKVAAKYPALTEAEVKNIVAEDKWLARLDADVQSELDRVSSALTGRILQLAERYATPLPTLTCEAEALAGRVEEHLKKMGAAWN